MKSRYNWLAVTLRAGEVFMFRSNRTERGINSLGLIFCLLFLCTVAAAQDTKVISALDVKYRKQIYKDPRFSVFLLQIPPTHASLMHRHDTDMLSVFVSGGATKSTIFGKPPVPDSFRAGDVRYRAGGFTHETENTGTTMFRAVILEFNSPAGDANADKPADVRNCNAGDAARCVDEKYLFCTAKFCVEDISIAPRAIWRDREFARDQMLIAVSDYSLSYKQGGKTASTRRRKSGEADYLAAGTERQWTNNGSLPAHVVTVIFH